jgi:hypothetical protein
MTRRAIPAPRKGHGRQPPGKDNVARGTSIGRTFGKRHRAQQEGGNGIGDQDLKEQLRLESKRASGKIFRKAVVLEILKRRVESSFRIRTLWHPCLHIPWGRHFAFDRNSEFSLRKKSANKLD